MNEQATSVHPLAATPAEVLQGALIDSRQRWRELIHLAADFAFETDEWGRFTLVTPDPALDWAAGLLIGRPSASLLAGAEEVFDPFRVTASIRHRQAWLKRATGGIACLSFCAAPILDADGRIAGTRGVGIDVTGFNDQTARLAGALRRAEVLDHIMSRMGQEVMASRMMDRALDVIANAIGAEGVAVVVAPTSSETARIIHLTGTGAEVLVPNVIQKLWPEPPASPEHAAAMLASNGTATTGPARNSPDASGLPPSIPRNSGPRVRRQAKSNAVVTRMIDEHPVLISLCQTRFGEEARLVAWRPLNGRPWDRDDTRLIESASLLIRMVMERENIQREMEQQAHTDSLTGLLNRRAFLEDMERHASRQDRDNQPATLMFADLDNFKPVNDRLGHEAGDEVLRRTAALLRKTFRPTDLIARLGGDEFAIWMNGADHMTAAERAEFLRDAVPHDLAEITDPDLPRVTVSIGIATREPGEGEPLENLMRRADLAMYEVKRGGRGHWRVSLLKRPSDGTG